jgi:hypothetical protein
MEKRIAPAMTVMAFEGKTNMKSLFSFIGDKPKEVVQEAVKAGFHPTGPQYWIYEWNDLNPEADFSLKICLPVSTMGKSYTGDRFKLEKLSSFNHVQAFHYGPWENLKDTYSSMMAEMTKQAIVPGMVCREVYINCDFEQPQNNITEIQFGIQ